MRAVLLSLILLGWVSVSSSEAALNVLEYYDFDIMMGRDTTLWKNIKTKEDFENYLFFQRAYEENKSKTTLVDRQIPYQVHFIWLGKKLLPPLVKKNLLSWQMLAIKIPLCLWVDEKIEGLPETVHQVLIRETPFLKDNTLLDSLKNDDERKELIRYLVLFHKGGVSVDTSYRMAHPFYPRTYDFFCALSPLSPSYFSSVITSSPAIIGCAPNHPILKECLMLIEKNWSEAARFYPGDEKRDILHRIHYRSRLPFHEAVMNCSDQNSIVLPAGFFHQLEGKYGNFAYQVTIPEFSSFQQKLEPLEHKFRKMKRRAHLYDAILIGINVLSLCLLGGILKKRLQRKEA